MSKAKSTSPLWHPYTQHAIAPDSIHIDRAAGAYLFARNEVNGVPKGERRIIDAISSWWVITHGHCHPEIMHAVQQQAGALDQVIFAGFTHEPAEMLAENLIAVTGDRLEHVFLSDSGSTAVEVALKMAIGYWEHSGHPRRKIIALEGGYHGDTFGTMSVGGRSVYHKLYEPYMFEVEHIPFPVAGCEAETFAALEKVLDDHKDDIAAFVFEPLLQAAGGMRVYSSDVLKTMADMCRAHGVLLIADEVMTGFGRTGTMFACQQADFVPDLMCMSKGLTGGFLPLGATLCSKDIYNAFYHKDKAKMFFHSSSFMGNPLSCAAANASLRIWEDDEAVQDKIDNIAKAHAEAAVSFARRGDLTNIRQKGTMLAMDLAVEDGGYLSDIQPKLYESFLSQGVLLRPLGNTVYILPPYCISENDLNVVYSAVNVALDKVF
ncbi:MAG: adenosylmethionine--8-amino-7-oxononanoate transaminase [Alphaproteobacteria bacterium]|nr:MAG: adenosylmethionine--8-amino-7-oxononanoate transaminase [Alphaproteobacteria bacterium]